MPTTIPPALAALTAPTPAANLSSRGHGTQGGMPFSRHLEQLRETRAQEARHGAAPNPPAPAAEPPARAEGQRPARPAAPTRVDGARAAHAHAPAPRPTQTAAEAAPGADPQIEKEARATTDTTDPATDELLASLNLVPNAATPAAELPTAAPTTPATPAALPPPPAAPATLATTAAAAGPALAAPDPAVQARAAGTVVSSLPASAQDLDPARLGERESAARTRPDANASPWQQAQAAALLVDHLQAPSLRLPAREAGPAAAHDLSAAAATITGVGNTVMHSTPMAESVNLSLATPVTSSEFRAALGMQVSMLARTGVQQAELHLNPAEMGPVSIQIMLDGQQAQVNFGADSALTRQLIEAGMPELASALRDAGLTLTGGGVSQHAGGQRQDPNANPAPSGQGGTAGSASAPEDQGIEVRRSALRTAQGGVDLYA